LEEGGSARVNGGTWYDPKDNLFKMWYIGGYHGTTCYAISKDGVHWERPNLNMTPGTNQIVKIESGEAKRLGFATIWLDLEEKDPQRRFKGIGGLKGIKSAFTVHFSPDGIHWSDAAAESGICGDTTTMFYNPFRKVWIYSAKENTSQVKRRCYWDCGDLVTGSYWTDEQHYSGKWVCADALDPTLPGVEMAKLYKLDGVAYESLILGMFTIWRGEPEDRLKPNNILLGFSRDGYTWDRTCRDSFISVSERYGDWNWCYMQSAGGCCLVVGDKLYFYVHGRSGIKGTMQSGVCSTGLAILRRDGFASMDAGESEGILTTRPVSFSGKYLFVNIDAPKGELRVEILDEKNNVIAPFTRENCIPITVDKTFRAVVWKGVENLSALSGKPIKFRFYLKNGKLYSFWVSPDKSGASHGYVAAGGPGFAGPTDADM
jgi:hypothetical protein